MHLQAAKQDGSELEQLGAQMSSGCSAQLPVPSRLQMRSARKKDIVIRLAFVQQIFAVHVRIEPTPTTSVCHDEQLGPASLLRH